LPPATNPGTLSVDDNVWQVLGGGVRRNDTATYSEVGPATLRVSDSTWASVDADDTDGTVRTITGSVAAGRFIPDHFRVTEAQLTPKCVHAVAGTGFSYVGELLAWNGTAVTLTAVDAGSNATQNYEGVFETLPGTLDAATYGVTTYAVYDDPALVGTPALNTAGFPEPAIGDAADGIALLPLPPLSFTRSVVQNFDAEIGIRLPAFADADGVVPKESPADLDAAIDLGTAAPGSGVGFVGGYKQTRFGRFQFDPAHGAEFLPLEVPLRAEYFDGASFVHNTLDTCTVLTTAHVTLTPFDPDQTHAVAGGNGLWTVTVSPADPPQPGIAGLTIDVAAPFSPLPVPYPALAADVDRDGVYAEDPQGTATFGLFSPTDQRIYQREIVGD
jgi:MSHA biogenesis protein MshQ